MSAGAAAASASAEALNSGSSSSSGGGDQFKAGDDDEGESTTSKDGSNPYKGFSRLKEEYNFYKKRPTRRSNHYYNNFNTHNSPNCNFHHYHHHNYHHHYHHHNHHNHHSSSFQSSNSFRYQYSPNSYTNLNGNTYYDYRQTSKSYSTDEIQQLIDSLVDDPDWWDYFTNPPKETHRTDHQRIEASSFSIPTSDESDEGDSNHAYCYVNNISSVDHDDGIELDNDDYGYESAHHRLSSSSYTQSSSSRRSKGYFIEEDLDLKENHYCHTDNELVDYLEKISHKQQTKLTKSKKKLNLFNPTSQTGSIVSPSTATTTTSSTTSSTSSSTMCNQEKIKLSKSDSAVSECSSFDDDEEEQQQQQQHQQKQQQHNLNGNSRRNFSLSSTWSSSSEESDEHSKSHSKSKTRRNSSTHANIANNNNNNENSKPTPLILLKTKNNNKLIGILKKKQSSTTTILIDKYKHSDETVLREATTSKPKHIIIKLINKQTDKNGIKDPYTVTTVADDDDLTTQMLDGDYEKHIQTKNRSKRCKKIEHSYPLSKVIRKRHMNSNRRCITNYLAHVVATSFICHESKFNLFRPSQANIISLSDYLNLKEKHAELDKHASLYVISSQLRKFKLISSMSLRLLDFLQAHCWLNNLEKKFVSFNDLKYKTNTLPTSTTTTTTTVNCLNTDPLTTSNTNTTSYAADVDSAKPFKYTTWKLKKIEKENQNKSFHTPSLQSADIFFSSIFSNYNISIQKPKSVPNLTKTFQNVLIRFNKLNMSSKFNPNTTGKNIIITHTYIYIYILNLLLLFLLF